MPNTRIKLLVARAGQDFSQSPGDELEVDSDEALRMVEAGQAVIFSPPILPAEPKESSDKPAVTELAKKTRTPKPKSSINSTEAPAASEAAKA